MVMRIIKRSIVSVPYELNQTAMAVGIAKHAASIARAIRVSIVSFPLCVSVYVIFIRRFVVCVNRKKRVQLHKIEHPSFLRSQDSYTLCRRFHATHVAACI